jgi:hypothetical protein
MGLEFHKFHFPYYVLYFQQYAHVVFLSFYLISKSKQKILIYMLCFVVRKRYAINFSIL